MTVTAMGTGIIARTGTSDTETDTERFTVIQAGTAPPTLPDAEAPNVMIGTVFLRRRRCHAHAVGYGTRRHVRRHVNLCLVGRLRRGIDYGVRGLGDLHAIGCLYQYSR